MNMGTLARSKQAADRILLLRRQAQEAIRLSKRAVRLGEESIRRSKQAIRQNKQAAAGLLRALRQSNRAR